MKLIYIMLCVLFFQGNQCAPGINPEEKTSDQDVLNADNQDVHEMGAAGGIFVRQSSRKKEPIPIVAPDKGVWTEIKEDSHDPEIKNDNSDHKTGTGGGIFVLEPSRMKEFHLKLKPATGDSGYQNKENDQEEDVHDTGTGEGVFLKEIKPVQSIPDVPVIPKPREDHHINDVHKVGTGGGTFILPIPDEEDEIATAGGFFVKDSQSIVGDRDLIKQPFPDLPKGIVTPKVPSSSNDDSTFIFRLNPADVAQAITSTVMKILAELNYNVKNPAITNWPVELVGRANALIDTKAKIAKRMVEEVGNFATGTIHNLDSLASGANFIAALNKN